MIHRKIHLYDLLRYFATALRFVAWNQEKSPGFVYARAGSVAWLPYGRVLLRICWFLFLHQNTLRARAYAPTDSFAVTSKVKLRDPKEGAI